MIQIIGQATQKNGGSPSWVLTGICKSAARTGTGTYTVTIDYLNIFGIDNKDKLAIFASAERSGLGTERLIIDWTAENTFRIRNYTARNNQTLGDCILTITIMADIPTMAFSLNGGTFVLNKFKFYDVTNEGGYINAANTAGYPGETNSITGVTASDAYKLSGYGITGANLTGNDFKYYKSNVSAEALFEHSKDLTLENGDHGVLSADKMSGFSGDVVTVDATTDEGWYFTGLNLTGATATGNQFMFVGENVTAEGLYTDEGYPITYIINGSHVNVTGDQIYIPGSTGITLAQTYDEYYRPDISVDNGSVENGVLIANGPCTVTVNDGLNTFTARGNLKWTNNFTGSYQGVQQAWPSLQITGWTSNYTPSSQMTGGIGTNYGATGTNSNNLTGQRGWKSFNTWQSESLRAPVNCSAWKMSGHINLTGQHNVNGQGILTGSTNEYLTAGIYCVGTNASPGTAVYGEWFPRGKYGTNTLSKDYVATAAKYGTATNLGSYGFGAIGWNWEKVTNGSRWTESWAYNRITNFNGTWYASGILP